MNNVLLLGMPGILEWVVILFILVPLLLLVMALIDILRSDFKDGNTKLIWLLVVILVGFIGPILYFIIGRGQKIGEGQETA